MTPATCHINDACNMPHLNQIRAMFAIILTACSPSSPTEIWERDKSEMAEDILRRIRRYNSNMNMNFTAEIYIEALIMIEDLCSEIADKVYIQLGMPLPNKFAAASFDDELRRERNYNTCDHLSYMQSNIPKPTHEHNGIDAQILKIISNGVGENFSIDAPGGADKTFPISLILTAFRFQNVIALSVALSGLAETLIPGGRTTHFAFKISLNMQFITSSSCNIFKALEKYCINANLLFRMNAQWSIKITVGSWSTIA